MNLQELCERWTAEQNRYRADGALVQPDRLIARFVDDLLALEQNRGELLNLTQAAASSGYSRQYLARLVRQGRLADHGRPRAPRLKMADLPIKPGHLPPAGSGREIGNTSRGQVVRSILHKD